MANTALYKVETSEGNFLMIAPIAIIADLFGAHEAAVHRAISEIRIDGKCTWHLGKRYHSIKYESIVLSAYGFVDTEIGGAQ